MSLTQASFKKSMKKVKKKKKKKKAKKKLSKAKTMMLDEYIDKSTINL